MSRHQSHGTLKQDRPSWRWQGRGVFAYTSQPTEAARYVAAFAQRQQAKELARIARYTFVPPVKPITDSARLIEAGRHVPDRRVAA